MTNKKVEMEGGHDPEGADARLLQGSTNELDLAFGVVNELDEVKDALTSSRERAKSRREGNSIDLTWVHVSR